MADSQDRRGPIKNTILRQGKNDERAYQLICLVYETVDIPSEFLKSIIYTILKKVHADKCKYYKDRRLIFTIYKN